MGIHLKCRRMENGIRKIITIVLGAALIAGAWSADAHAASANAPVPKSVTYQGKGKVQVIFREKVRYRDPKVIVRDEDGKKYKLYTWKQRSGMYLSRRAVFYHTLTYNTETTLFLTVTKIHSCKNHQRTKQEPRSYLFIK